MEPAENWAKAVGRKLISLEERRKKKGFESDDSRDPESFPPMIGTKVVLPHGRFGLGIIAD